MRKLTSKKLVENRLFLFLPCFYIYLSVIIFTINSLKLKVGDLRSLLLGALPAIAISQAVTSHYYFKVKRIDKDIYLLSWGLTVLGICLLGLVYFMKVTGGNI